MKFINKILDKIRNKKNKFYPIKTRDDDILKQKKYCSSDKKKSTHKNKYDYIKKIISKDVKFSFLLSTIGILLVFMAYTYIIKNIAHTFDIIFVSAVLFSAVLFFIFAIIYTFRSIKEEYINKPILYFSMLLPAAMLVLIVRLFIA